MLKGHMARERLGSPGLKLNFLKILRSKSPIAYASASQTLVRRLIWYVGAKSLLILDEIS